MLLIVAALDDRRLEELYERLASSTSTVWWRSTTKPISSARWRLDADVIGINNRNLDDLSVDIETTVELLTDVPAGKTVVSESGYRAPRAARRAGARSASMRC